MSSLFGHLAFRFAAHPENLATEALGFMLGKSEAVRKGLLGSLGAAAGGLPPDLRFQTQAGTEEQGRPDLAGIDDSGKARVLMEAKFWAGFTDHQPLSYLEQLPAGGVLLVVGPEARLTYLWRELLRRLREARRSVEEHAVDGQLRSAAVEGKHLLLSSWDRMLGAISLELSHEPDVLADVAQLRGLCKRMDADAFIPVTGTELTDGVFRRVHEFGKIVDDVAAELAARGHASQRGLRSSAGNGWYGRYLRLRGVNVLLHFTTWKWATAPTPLWLTVYGERWHKSDPAPVHRQLAGLPMTYGQAVFNDALGFPSVPLKVPVGAERHEVVAAVVEQVRKVGEVLAPMGAGASVETAPPEQDSVP